MLNGGWGRADKTRLDTLNIRWIIHSYKHNDRSPITLNATMGRQKEKNPSYYK